MNQFLNNNSDEIIKEMKPAANAALAKHFKGFLNTAFLNLPLKIWLPDAWAPQLGAFIVLVQNQFSSVWYFLAEQFNLPNFIFSTHHQQFF